MRKGAKPLVMVIIVWGVCVSGSLLLFPGMILLLLTEALRLPDIIAFHVVMAVALAVYPLGLLFNPWPLVFVLQTAFLAAGVLGVDALLLRTRASRQARYSLLVLTWALVTFSSNVLIRALPLGTATWMLSAPR